MKAKIIATNDIIEVHQVKPGDIYFLDDNNNPYRCNELDFNVDKEDTTTSIAKLFGISPITSLEEAQEKQNEMHLKYDRAKSSITREELLLTFQCDMVRIIVSKLPEEFYVSLDERIPDIISTVRQFSKKIFGVETV